MTGGRVVYLDSSAIIKLVVLESESTALERFLDAWPSACSSIIARVEVMRHALRHPRRPLDAAEQALSGIELLPVTPELVANASQLPPALLRSLDAIHLAAALSIRDDLGPFVTYDTRLAEAGRLHGLEVASPGVA